MEQAVGDAPGAPVLVIDDDAAVRDLLRLVLEDAGYPVVDAAAPPSIDALRVLAPRAVVTDIRFRGGGDGVAFAAAIRADPALARLPVVLCSGATEVLRDRTGAIARLGVAVLPKPFDLDDVLRLVARPADRA